MNNSAKSAKRVMASWSRNGRPSGSGSGSGSRGVMDDYSESENSMDLGSSRSGLFRVLRKGRDHSSTSAIEFDSDMGSDSESLNASGREVMNQRINNFSVQESSRETFGKFDENDVSTSLTAVHQVSTLLHIFQVQDRASGRNIAEEQESMVTGILEKMLPIHVVQELKKGHGRPIVDDHPVSERSE